MSFYAIVCVVVFSVIGALAPPFMPVQRDESTYVRQDAESFANQLMWMGQDDGQ